MDNKENNTKKIKNLELKNYNKIKTNNKIDEYPKQWAYSKVIPILNKGDSNKSSNYRVITVN